MKMILYIMILLIFFLNSSNLFGQILQDTASDGKGRIEVIADTRIDNLVEKHISINEKLHGFPGYRVQIYFGSKRKEALEIKTKFSSKFPDITAYLSYNDPYFKIRAGDCRTKLEAEKLFVNILSEFPGSFIVDDLVCLPLIDCKGM